MTAYRLRQPATHRLYIAPNEWEDIFQKVVNRRIDEHIVFLGAVETIAVYEDDRVEPGKPIYVRIEDDGIKPRHST